jgi:hypothetical protein
MPDKTTSYQHLQPEERLAIASLRLQDVSIRAMALSDRMHEFDATQQDGGRTKILECVA